jgi:predicted transcriptional regulator
MTRSRFETYLCILKVLITNGPLKTTRIAYISNLEPDLLIEYLGFLIKQRAVEERKIDNERSNFAITQHGAKLVKYFWQTELPLIKKEE